MKSPFSFSTTRTRLIVRACLWLLLCACALTLSFKLAWQQQRVAAAPQQQQTASTAQKQRDDRALAGLIRQLTNRSSEGLTKTTLPEGGYAIDLKGRFQQVPVVRVAPDGAVVNGCVESLAEANAFFSRDLETGEPLESRLTENLSAPSGLPGISQQEYYFYQNLIEDAVRRRQFAPALATINIVNNDGPGEGFNDPTMTTAEGGNTGTTLGEQRLNLFNYAASIWTAFLDSSVNIKIRAGFDPLTPCSPSGAVLGFGGSVSIFRDFPNATLTGTWYHGALANKLYGGDLDTANSDLNAIFNSSIDAGCLGSTRFYYGFDNFPPSGTINLLIVLLHEFGHGLGFSSFVDGSTGQTLDGLPDIYMRFMFDRSTGLLWSAMTDAQRQASAVNAGNVLWNGANVRIASGWLTAGRDAATGRVQLYTPNPLQGGSSISHWDTPCSPNLLMEPYISALPLDLDLTRQQMRDIGWYRDSTADHIGDTITNVAPSGGGLQIGSSVNITWTNTGGFNRNVTIELSTDGGATFPTALAIDIPNTGSFAWTVPNTPITTARVRVREHDFAAPLGSSAANFAIANCSTVTVNPATLPAGTRNTAYSQTFAQTGGTTPINWSRSAGAFPTGLTLSAAGVLSGTPTTAGTFNFTIQATGANGCSGARSYALVINCTTITVNPTSLPAGSSGAAYSQPLTQTGGTAPITWSLSAGALPAGLALSAAGALSGTPTTTGSFTFTATATDAQGCVGARSYTLVINCLALTINPATLPAGTRGTAYSQPLTQTGGTGTIVWNLSAGTLPAGLALSAAGVLSGTPTATGSSTFTVKATDAQGCTGTRSYTLVINCLALTVNPTTLPPGTRNVNYSQTFTQSGGTGTIKWSRSAGTLPKGLTLSAAGVLSGKPTTAGSSTFTVKATDAQGCTGTRSYTLVIQ